MTKNIIVDTDIEHYFLIICTLLGIKGYSLEFKKRSNFEVLIFLWNVYVKPMKIIDHCQSNMNQKYTRCLFSDPFYHYIYVSEWSILD